MRKAAAVVVLALGAAVVVASVNVAFFDDRNLGHEVDGSSAADFRDAPDPLAFEFSELSDRGQDAFLGALGAGQPNPSQNLRDYVIRDPDDAPREFQYPSDYSSTYFVRYQGRHYELRTHVASGGEFGTLLAGGIGFVVGVPLLLVGIGLGPSRRFAYSALLALGVVVWLTVYGIGTPEVLTVDAAIAIRVAIWGVLWAGLRFAFDAADLWPNPGGQDPG